MEYPDGKAGASRNGYRWYIRTAFDPTANFLYEKAGWRVKCPIPISVRSGPARDCADIRSNHGRRTDAPFLPPGTVRDALLTGGDQ